MLRWCRMMQYYLVWMWEYSCSSVYTYRKGLFRHIKFQEKTENTQNYITFLRLLLTFRSQTSHSSPTNRWGGVGGRQRLCMLTYFYLPYQMYLPIRSACNLNEFLSALVVMYSMGYYNCSSFCSICAMSKGCTTFFFIANTETHLCSGVFWGRHERFSYIYTKYYTIRTLFGYYSDFGKHNQKTIKKNIFSNQNYKKKL